MTRAVWTTSRKYPGVRTYHGQKGKVFYIAYNRAGKQILEKVGTEKEGYSLELAATIRGNRVQAVRHGEELPRDRKDIPTFGEVAKKFLEWAVSHKKSARDDVSRYRHHLAPRFGNVPVDQIAPLDLERLKKEMAEAGKSPGTIRLTLALFRSIFNKGRAWNLIRTENPMGRVRMPQVDNARERFLSKAEVELLLNSLAERSRQAHDLAVLALNTGARSGELLGLNWGDVNLDSRILVFRN
ncbi:MAG: site-specific integrase, partial [Proteobacteria bacterium]|nr:site-specific integrase [Pseudomonadota bacterium]